ncbi:SUPPRESSOR OF GAMMA RESPONSE 1-like isoform X2 [Gastrolobium bilobum]|uniref:SUPPRESSOR OF GAMMA RESPONSE 1-like isoform X2 n=1 Tax=Gastrolobium bilobum TaxID=150636 RepID=UPI002AB0EF18|nr:SUPPRESSOR OF GAMMA RESPONSE 1-like isoform X2 [Gastrolobium bilobum]
MAGPGPSWLVDKSRIATKIKSASGAYGKAIWESDPTRACPNCQHVIDNSDVAQEWPGLPKGVKFDPSDQEIIWHLLAKVCAGNSKPHPFIDEFITTLEDDDGICHTHPQHLPGVKQDGSASHFFHRAIKAYNTGNRKRRKIYGQDFGDVRWHKTGRTKPVILNGVQKGCKKFLVLYMSPVREGKAEKTNWVMHQYHLGTEEDEKDGEYVISKVFYQQQQVKLGEKDDQDIRETTEATIVKVDPVTPKSVTPEPPRNEKRCSNLHIGQESHHIPQHPEMDCVDGIQADGEEIAKSDQLMVETQNYEDNIENNAEDPKWWDSESQNLLDSQQLVEALSLCDDLLQSQSPNRDGKNGEHEERPSLAIYAHLGPEHLKKDIEECQNLVLDPANVELETPPSEFRLSQLEFGSQDSYISWGGSKAIN